MEQQILALTGLVTDLVAKNQLIVDQNQALIAELRNQPQPQAQQVNHVLKIRSALRHKNCKVPDFVEGGLEVSARIWLRRLDHEIEVLRSMEGMAAQLTRDEYVQVVRDKLHVTVVHRLSTVFATKNPPWTWEAGGNAVSIDQLKQCLIEEYDSKRDPVAVLLQQFSPSRLKKDPAESVSSYYHKFLEQLPPPAFPSDRSGKERTGGCVSACFILLWS